MNATDLMIGDWVMTGIDIVQVAAIDDRGIYIDDPIYTCLLHVDFRFVKPILLTGEILKNNGFAFDEIDGSYRHIDLGLWIGGRHEPFGCMISNIYVELNYVHELQHALRLCGIKKEFILLNFDTKPKQQ